MPRIPALLMLRSTIGDDLRPCGMPISWLNPTPHTAAVYASWPPLPSAHATLASRRLATPYLRWTFTSRSRQLCLAPSSNAGYGTDVAAGARAFRDIGEERLVLVWVEQSGVA